MSFIVPEQPVGDDRWAMWERQAAGIADTPTMSAVPGLGQTPDGQPTGTADIPTAAFAPAAGFAPGGAFTESRPTSAAAPDAATASEPDPGRAWEPARSEHRSGGGGGALVFGLILVVLGGFFLARSYIPNIDWDRSWPILLVVIGAVLLVGALRRASPGPR
jgi:hypothetical protein